MKELKKLVIGVLVFAPIAVALSCDNVWVQILGVLYGAMLYATRKHFAKFWREFGNVVDTMLTNVEKQYNN